MGNKPEEVKIQKELDDLDEQEIKINLEIYKLQTEINKRVPKDQQKKLKNNYIHKIDKWKTKNNPEQNEKTSNYDPYDETEFDAAKKDQNEWNKKNEQQNENNNKKKEEDKTNKTKNKKNKEHFLDSGIPKLKKRIKELENIDKEDEKNDIRKNKEKIKRDYLKELNQVEQDIFEEDVKEEMIRNIYQNLDTPDINENLLADKLSELYNNDGNNEYSYYEDNYSNNIQLYQDIVKDKTLRDRTEDINIKFLKPGIDGDNGGDNKDDKGTEKDRKKWRKGENKNGIKYEYQVKRNKIMENALDKRNHIVKNGDFLKDDHSPYSENDSSEGKSDNVSQYY